MSNTPEEIDAADALARELLHSTQLWEAVAQETTSVLVHWSPDGSNAQVDHYVEQAGPVLSVFTAHGQNGPKVLNRKYGQTMMHRNKSTYQPTQIWAPELAETRSLHIDGHPVEAQYWADKDYWWLAVDLPDGTALVVKGAPDFPIPNEIRCVTDIEPLLAARRKRLLSGGV